MAPREAVQESFGVNPDNSLTPNLLNSLFTRFGDARKITHQILTRKVWQEVGPGKTVIVDLIDPQNRQLHFLDKTKNLFDEQPFYRRMKIRGIRMAVVLIPEVNESNKSVIEEDLVAIVDRMPKSKKNQVGGGLIVVEKLTPGTKPENDKKVELVADISSRLTKPGFLAAGDGYCLWEFRKKLPNETLIAVQERKRAIRNKREGVGTKVFENLNAGVSIVEITPKGIAVSQVGEEDGLGQLVEFKSNVVVPEFKNDAQRRLSYVLGRQEGQPSLQPKTYQLGERVMNKKCSNGNWITENIWTEGSSPKTGKIKLQIAHTCSCHGDLNLQTKYVKSDQIIQVTADAA